jgi:hypothetical protein
VAAAEPTQLRFAVAARARIAAVYFPRAFGEGGGRYTFRLTKYFGFLKRSFRLGCRRDVSGLGSAGRAGRTDK